MTPDALHCKQCGSELDKPSLFNEWTLKCPKCGPDFEVAEHAAMREKAAKALFGEMGATVLTEADAFQDKLIERMGHCNLETSVILGVIEARRAIGKSDSEILETLAEWNS